MITFQNGETRGSLDFAKKNLQSLGNLERVSHKRNKQNVFYETTIEGNRDTMVITGGLGSGYDGEGPGGLFDLLIELGVTESLAKKEVFDNQDTVYNFDITL